MLLTIPCFFNFVPKVITYLWHRIINTINIVELLFADQVFDHIYLRFLSFNRADLFNCEVEELTCLVDRVNHNDQEVVDRFEPCKVLLFYVHSVLFVQELHYSNYLLQRFVFGCPRIPLDMLLLYNWTNHCVIGLYHSCKVVNRGIESEFLM